MATSSSPPLPPYSQTVLPKTIGTTTPFAFLAILFYSARIYTRLRLALRLRWDDYFMSLAIVFALAVWLIEVVSVVSTGGRHVEYVSPAKISYNLHFGFAMWPMSIWATIFVKLSVALLLLRLKQNIAWQVGLKLLIASLVTVGTGVTIFQMLQCRPMSANWNFASAYPKCASPRTIQVLAYCSNSFFVATDFACALLPITFIRVISRPLRERVVLGILMALGLVAGAAGIVKMTLLGTVRDSHDIFYDTANIGIWMNIETFVGIIAACTPCLKSSFERILRRLGLSWETKRQAGLAMTGLPSGTKPALAVWNWESTDGSGSTEGMEGFEMPVIIDSDALPDRRSAEYAAVAV